MSKNQNRLNYSDFIISTGIYHNAIDNSPLKKAFAGCHSRAPLPGIPAKQDEIPAENTPRMGQAGNDRLLVVFNYSATCTKKGLAMSAFEGDPLNLFRTDGLKNIIDSETNSLYVTYEFYNL